MEPRISEGRSANSMERQKLLRLKPWRVLGLAAGVLALAVLLSTQADAQATRELKGWGERKATLKPGKENPFKVELKNVEHLSWTPRLSVYHNLLTDEECDHLVEISKAHLYKSGVVGQTGESLDTEIRTSKGTFLNRGQDEIVTRIESKLAAWTQLPVEYGEGLQILNYQKGQKYDPHFDYFFHNDGEANGGNRVATVLMYLTNTEEGGETVFPNSKLAGERPGQWSDCAKMGLAYHPKKGDALLFWTMTPGGDLDRYSLHGSCPVIKGEKWSATKWIHVGEYVMFGGGKRIHIEHPWKEPPAPLPTTGCFDSVEDCNYWAIQGECEKNSGFMIGTAENPGACRRSCNKCADGKGGDSTSSS